MLVGLGCGDNKSCGCSHKVEEGLAGILGDLGDVCGGYPSASNYATRTSFTDSQGNVTNLIAPLTPAQNAAYEADAAAYNNCLVQAQGAPACPPGSSFQGGFAGGSWQGKCVNTTTGKAVTAIATTPGVSNNVSTAINGNAVQVGPACPSGYMWDGLNGLLRGLRGLAGCTPTAATLAAQVAAQSASDLAAKKLKAASECPAGYQWDGVLDSVTSGLSGCIPVPATTTTAPNQTTQQQQVVTSTGITSTQSDTSEIVQGVSNTYLLLGGIGLLGLIFLVGER